MATAICQNFAHVAAVRFFLGVFECALTPSFIMITGMWYTRKEQPFRIGICKFKRPARADRQGTR
jgi:MFS family permease